VTGPLNFIKFNFDTEIHFTYFQFFFGLEKREEGVRLQLRERMFVSEDLSHQNNCFLCHVVPYDEEN